MSVSMKADTLLFEPRPPVAKTRTLGAEPGNLGVAVLHSSLKLGDILRGCRHLLAARLELGRLTFVQHRVSESTVTIFSADEDGASPLLGPKVIVLGTSRLSRCITEQSKLVVNLRGANECDVVEQEHLLCPNAGCVVYLPLLLHGRLKGILVLSLPGNVRLVRSDHDFLEFLAGHLALAIENSDAHYMEQRRGRQLTMIGEIARQAVMLEDVGEFLRGVPEFLRQGFNYDLVQVWTVGAKQDGIHLAGCAHRAIRHESACACVPAMVEEGVEQGQTFCVNNCLGDGAPAPCCDGVASQLAVPIRLRGKPLGVLCLASTRLDAFPADDVNIMGGVASVIATAFENLRAFKHAQQSKEYMQAIVESAKDQAIISTDLDGCVMTSSAGSQAVFGLSQQEMLGKYLVSLFPNEQFRQELAGYLGDTAQMSLEKRKLPNDGAGENSLLDVTVQRVFDPEGRHIGFLCLARDVTENVLLEERLEALSITDELTRLYNKRHFFAVLTGEIERTRRFKHRISLCFFDLDGLKQYNDTRGHLSGDKALEETAKLIQALVRSNVDSCYRYGGDEFTIIMPGTGKFNAQLVVERIRARLSDNFQGMITASIGIAECSATDTAESLVEKADRAMYTAKARGGNRVHVSD